MCRHRPLRNARKCGAGRLNRTVEDGSLDPLLRGDDEIQGVLMSPLHNPPRTTDACVWQVANARQTGGGPPLRSTRAADPEAG